jgi:phosphatidylethanolamine/phosphatidyl-N-methylethanolamine N-methyltransferase
VNADASVFFALWLQKPLRIAAANPSGARLADAVARCIDLARPGWVLELGAGTGSLTQGIVRAGCPPERIIAIERSRLSSRYCDVIFQR